jgi:hypothetical protein
MYMYTQNDMMLYNVWTDVAMRNNTKCHTKCFNFTINNYMKDNKSVITTKSNKKTRLHCHGLKIQYHWNRAHYK